MTNLKKSFFISAFIYALLILFIVYIAQEEPKRASATRIAVDPSNLHLVKPTPSTQKKHAKKRTAKKKKQIVKKEQKLFSPKKRLIKPDQHHTAQKKPLPKISPQRPPKNVSLPNKNVLIQSLLDKLPDAKESKPHVDESEKALKDLYGKKYTALSLKAKKYLKDNLLVMQAITQKTLNRIGRMYLDPRFYYYDYNAVEFMLYPDGSIGKITLLKDAGFELLDKITRETIETAYKDYPLPDEPTLIRYKFFYDLRSF